MKLAILNEVRASRTSDDRNHEKAKGQKAQPADFRVFLKAIETAPSLEQAKEQARKMTKFFELGGEEKFLKSVDKARNMLDLVTLAYNTQLKGEGLGVIGSGRTGRTRRSENEEVTKDD